MKKRIVICADGTWNRPEKDLSKDFPTNVLKLARAIRPVAEDGTPQQVFYDWGVGSYYDPVIGGAMMLVDRWLEHRFPQNPVLTDIVFAVTTAPDGSAWIGSYGGVARIAKLP